MDIVTQKKCERNHIHTAVLETSLSLFLLRYFSCVREKNNISQILII